MIDTLSTAEFWKIVEAAFIRPRNITFDRHVFLITKQLRVEAVEHFYGKLKELAENCDFENKEEALTRDVFITNLIDPEIQKELLKQTVEPRQALQLAVNMELGMRNQHQIKEHNKTLIPASVIAIHLNKRRSSNWAFSHNFQKPNNRPPLYCSNCGVNLLSNHRDKCIAKGKTCNNCRLMNHFAKICRKQNNAKPQNSMKRTVITLDEEPHPEDSVSFLRSIKLYESDYSSGDDKTVALIEIDVAKIEPLNMPVKIGNISSTLLVDSGSACRILNRSLATQVVKSRPHAVWIHEKVRPQIRTFSNEPIHIEGKIQDPIGHRTR